MNHDLLRDRDPLTSNSTSNNITSLITTQSATRVFTHSRKWRFNCDIAFFISGGWSLQGVYFKTHQSYKIIISLFFSSCRELLQMLTDIQDRVFLLLFLLTSESYAWPRWAAISEEMGSKLYRPLLGSNWYNIIGWEKFAKSSQNFPSQIWDENEVDNQRRIVLITTICVVRGWERSLPGLQHSHVFKHPFTDSLDIYN